MESKSISGVTSTYISSPVCPTGVMHVLLHVEVTPNIDLDSMKILGLVATKPVCGVSDKAILKPVSLASETS